MPHIDGTNGGSEARIYYRDSGRLAFTSAVHSLTVKGSDAWQMLNSMGKYDLSRGDRPDAFNFDAEHSALEGEKAETIKVAFHSGYVPRFVYNENTGEYLRWEFGAAHIDGITGEQVSVKNVFILRMQLTDVAGSSLGLVEINTYGSGSGWYACDGRIVPITWKRSAYGQGFTYYDQNGVELSVAPGRSFVEVIFQTSSVSWQ